MSNQTIKKSCEFPIIHPEELAILESRVGRSLSNDEAQELIHELAIWEMYMNFVENGPGELQ